MLPGEQFPSNVYGWRRLVASGVRLRMIAAPTQAEAGTEGLSVAALWNARLQAAADSDCAVVAVETAHWPRSWALA